MPRFDISRLRKENNMSQGELANLLQITQSFLSAIENGKSPLPIEKEGKLCEIFGLKDLGDYILDAKPGSIEKNLTEMTDSDLFNQLLSRFHKQAHSVETEQHHHDHHQKIDELQDRLDSLFKRNETLLLRNDSLNGDIERLRAEIDIYRKEIDSLRAENYALKCELLKK